MFYRARRLSNPFAVHRLIILLFDVESQIFVTMSTSDSLCQISVTPLLSALKDALIVHYIFL